MIIFIFIIFINNIFIKQTKQTNKQKYKREPATKCVF
jgi:hypothetical protein